MGTCHRRQIWLLKNGQNLINALFFSRLHPRLLQPEASVKVCVIGGYVCLSNPPQKAHIADFESVKHCLWSWIYAGKVLTLRHEYGQHHLHNRPCRCHQGTQRKDFGTGVRTVCVQERGVPAQPRQQPFGVRQHQAREAGRAA